MRTTWLPLTFAILLSFVGLRISGEMVQKHMGRSSGWLASLCESDSDNVSCDVVLSSEWAYFPPKKPSSIGVHYPVAWLGQAYFTFLLAWYVLVGRTSRDRLVWHLLPLGLNTVGVLGSVWFVYIMKTQIGVWCPLCLMSHGANVLLLVSSVLLWPRKPLKTGDEQIATAATRVGGYPSGRLAIATILLAWAMGVIQLNGMTSGSLKAQNNRLTKHLKDIQKNVEGLVGLHAAGKRQEIRIRGDDPSRFGAAHNPAIVEWSDFQCPGCRRFAEQFDATFAGYFDGAMRLVFKHYPLDPACNPYVSRAIHGDACEMARMAEAARLVGGDDAFWKAHDILFAAQKSPDERTTAVVVEKLGLDLEAFTAAMGSGDVTRRIREDIEQAHELGVTGTPSIFLDGRRVDSLTRGVSGFWQSMGRAYQRARAMNATRRKAATPDTQGPPIAP